MLTKTDVELMVQHPIRVVTIGNLTREPASRDLGFQGSVSRQIIKLCDDFLISEAVTKEILRKAAEDVVGVGRAVAYRRALNRIYDAI